MASDKEKTKASKGASKKKQTQKFNWSKAFIIFILVMVLFGMVAAWVSMGGNINSANSNNNGTIDRSFNNIVDALNIIPTGANYVRYSDMADDSNLSLFLNSNYGNTIPDPQIFDASALKDALVVYPPYTFDYLQQSSIGDVVSLTDFGNQTLNQSYPQVYANLNGNSVPLSQVSSTYDYYFTPKTSPVVSGTENATLAMLYQMDDLSSYNTSYDDYSGLFNELNDHQIPINGMTLEAVGNNATFPISNINLSIEQFYAGIGPTSMTVVLNNTTYTEYNYTAILQVNQSPSSQDVQMMYLLSGSNEKSGFSYYNVSVYTDNGNYIVLTAQAPLPVCIDDMETWGFMKYGGTSQ